MEARWLVLGDFNMIYGVEDKNNQLVNFRMLNRFKNTIDNLQLAPLALHGRRFTWCNEQQDPTMTKIDHFLASAEWLEIFPRTDLQAMASLGSDHCPLFLQGDISFDFCWGFRFEAHWVNIPGFFWRGKDGLGTSGQHTKCNATHACKATANRKTLRETVKMPSALCLPSVLYRTLGKRQLCRVFPPRHSAYLRFAECQHLATIRYPAYLIFAECQHSASMGHSAITNT